jgi:hypothetical protein
MTRDDITRLAREANLGNVLCHNSVEGDRVFIEGADWHDEVERFAALVAAAEREACACDVEQYGGAWDATTSNFARLIRARSKE